MDTKMNLKEIRCEGVDWIHVDQNRGLWKALVDMEINHEIS
jgi:hypothetical protein